MAVYTCILTNTGSLIKAYDNHQETFNKTAVAVLLFVSLLLLEREFPGRKYFLLEYHVASCGQGDIHFNAKVVVRVVVHIQLS